MFVSAFVFRTARAVLPGCLLALALAACSSSSDRVRLFHTEAHAPSLSEAQLRSMDFMGPVVIDAGVNFAVYSENAERIDLHVFDDPESERPTRSFPMVRLGDVWSLYVEGLTYGQHYGYSAWGPNWPVHPEWFVGSIEGFEADVDALGNRFNPNKLLIDPWAKAVHRDHDWSRASNASGPDRTASTFGAAAKSVVVQSHHTWSDDEAEWRELRQNPDAEGHRWNELIIYEVHLKGFTKSPASGVDHPGTYRGLGEKADYLADLGINAVELLPIHEKPLDGGYWGYNNISFFAPEFEYASVQDPFFIIDEFKWMVDELHKRGIEVLIDVVYNHTGEGGLWREKLELNDFSPEGGPSYEQLSNLDPREVAGLYSFRGLDNIAYYALQEEDKGFYWNNTGVGNQTRPNHRPMRRLTMDSLRWMVEELHVDGFRFDLGPILGEQDLNYNYWDEVENTVLQDIIDDPVLQKFNTRIISEPWSAGGFYGVKIGAFPSASNAEGVGWYEWNARFRDWWRAFVNFDDWKLNSQEADADGGFVMTGFDRYYRWNDRRPYHTVNFITVHDGFTMYDLVSYNEKQNKCGPINPICCDDPFSPWCDRDSGEEHNRSRNWGSDPAGEANKRQMMRNFFAGMMISHGTPMLWGGDEWMRTQLGNNNAYSTWSDNAFNWFDWGAWNADDFRHRMHDFVRNITRFRHEHRYALAPSQYGEGAPFAWKSAQNTEPPDWNGKHLMIHYYDPSFGPELCIIINMERNPVSFTLPSGREWRRVVDTQRWFDGDAYLNDESGENGGARDSRRSWNITLDAPPIVTDSYEAQDSSIVILEAAAAP